MSLWPSLWMSVLSLMGYANHCRYDPSREIPDLSGKVAIVTGVRCVARSELSAV
jgi:hypothetical protein